MIKVIVVDDHKVFSDGIISILNEVEDITINHSASNAKELIKLLEIHPIDVILMDITLGKESGLDLTTTVKRLYPNIKVLILSMHSDRAYILKAIESGASGYLLKEIGGNEMVKAIREVYNGGTYYSQKISNILINHLTDTKLTVNNYFNNQLTPREKEVIILICKEYTNQEIAKELFISIRTVDTHRRNLLEKLKVKNTVGLVKYAIKVGLVDPDIE